MARQRVAGDAEQLGGAGDVAAAFRQHPANVKLRRLIKVVGVGEWLVAAGRFKATPCGGRRGARPTNGPLVLCGRRKPSVNGACPRREPCVQLAVLADERGEVGLFEHRRALEQIEQLAHVAGIVVALKRRALRLVQRLAVVMRAPPGVCDERNVLAMLAQGRRPDLYDVEPLVFAFTDRFAG